MFMITATALQTTMDIFLINIIDKFYISYVKFFQCSWILSRLHADFLQLIQVCDG